MSLTALHKQSHLSTMETFGSSVPRNPLVEGAHVSHDSVMYPMKLDIPSNQVPTITSASSASRKVIIKLPRAGHLQHIGLKVGYGTTGTADYIDNLGVGMLELIELKSGGKKPFEVNDPRNAILYALSKLDPEGRSKMLAVMGGLNIGSSSTAGSIMIWLPMWFDKLIAPGVAPLNLNQLTSDAELHITFKVNTSILKATGTGGSVTAVSAVCYMVEAENEVVNQSYHSFAFDSIITEQVVATATETSLDVKGVSGNTKELFITQALSTDLLVDFALLNTIDSIRDKLNNNEEDIFLTANEGFFDYLMQHEGRGYNETQNYPYTIPYTLYDKDAVSNHYGGVEGRHINQHLVKLTHSAGANSAVSVTAIVSAIYVHKRGMIIKME